MDCQPIDEGRCCVPGATHCMLSRVKIAAATMNGEGRFLWCNAAFEMFLGWNQSQLRGRTWEEITVPEDRAADRELMTRLDDEGGETYEIDKRFLNRFGLVVKAHVTVHAVTLGEARYVKIAIPSFDFPGDSEVRPSPAAPQEEARRVTLQSRWYEPWLRWARDNIAVLVVLFTLLGTWARDSFSREERLKTFERDIAEIKLHIRDLTQAVLNR